MDEKIRITPEDLARVNSLPAAVAGPSAAAPSGVDPQTGAKRYGNIADMATGSSEVAPEKARFYLKDWFYLGMAGALGACAAWGTCEPAFFDGQRNGWGNTWLIPLTVTMTCIALGVADAVVERSVRKFAIRGVVSLGLGVVLGFIFLFIAGLTFMVGIGLLAASGVESYRSPFFWLARGLAWMVFGSAAGLVYGIAGQSGKRTLYGVIGGVIGSGLGGVLFDPISMAVGGGAASRAVGFTLGGLATGVAIGIVGSALKDRWLYVTAGPLAGKQFILYKQRTVAGSSQGNDIYLFKDPSILPQHATFDTEGRGTTLRATGLVYVAGQPVRTRVLASGDIVQIGRYSFHYQEKPR